MAENSFFWTTTGSPSGHQVASYTQAHWSTAAEIMAACAGFEGVAPGYKNELAVTYISANHCHVNSGGAVVDGKVYINDAPELGVTIDSATAGHYRIDRIVALCDWAAFTVTIAVKKNTVEDTVAPALTLTEDWTVSGTHYAILLYQASVTDTGVVTLTDERNFADVGTNGIGASAVTLAKMAANSVDSDQYVDASIDTAHIALLNITQGLLAVGASKVTNRQGGSASDWSTSGTNNYAPSTARIQLGSIQWTGVAATSGNIAVTFPVAFSNGPIVLVSISDGAHGNASETSSGCTIYWYSSTNQTSLFIRWLAIGPE